MTSPGSWPSPAEPGGAAADPDTGTSPDTRGGRDAGTDPYAETPPDAGGRQGAGTDPYAETPPDAGGRQGAGTGRRRPLDLVGTWPALVAPPLLGVIVLVVVWQLVATHDHYVLPHPSAVAAQLIDSPAAYAADAATTLREAMIGFVIGFGAAVALAVVMTQFGWVKRAVLPLALIANVTPVVAIAPALVVAFGFGATPKIVMTAVICFFPALINAVAGLRDADPALLEVLDVLHASTLEILWRVRLPSSLPNLFVAARICLPLSVIAAVVAELVSPGSSSGLGTVISQAASNAQLDRVYAAVVCLGLIGVALTGLVALVERRALSWHRGQPPG